MCLVHFKITWLRFVFTFFFFFKTVDNEQTGSMQPTFSGVLLTHSLFKCIHLLLSSSAPVFKALCVWESSLLHSSFWVSFWFDSLSSFFRCHCHCVSRAIALFNCDRNLGVSFPPTVSANGMHLLSCISYARYCSAAYALNGRVGEVMLFNGQWPTWYGLPDRGYHLLL